MVFIQKVCYELGGLIADAVFITVMPIGCFTSVKVATKFSKFATEHALVKSSLDVVTNNLYDCLQFIE
jgi:hypothetical protein